MFHLNTILSLYAYHQTYALAAIGCIVMIAAVIIGPSLIKK
jgi:hypothetical protein